jgi:hypothetical protein
MLTHDKVADGASAGAGAGTGTEVAERDEL